MPAEKKGSASLFGDAPRAAILARVSTEHQHLDTQTRALLEDAERRGFRVVEVVEDVGTGTRMRERSGLRRVLELAEAGEIDVVLVAELSRLGRSLSGLATVVERLTQGGVGLVSMRESFDLSSPMGRMVCGILSVLAVWEADVLRERTKAGLKAAKARGSAVGNAPYGTRWTEEGLVPAAEEIDVLRRGWALRRALGTWKRAAAALSAEGATSPGGSAWRGDRLSRACRNPRVQPFLDEAEGSALALGA